MTDSCPQLGAENAERRGSGRSEDQPRENACGYTAVNSAMLVHVASQHVPNPLVVFENAHLCPALGS